MHLSASALWLHELGSMESVGFPANVFPQGVTQKRPDVIISAWCMQRQGRNRLCIATSLCCDGLLPTEKGVMKALRDPSICTPDS